MIPIRVLVVDDHPLVRKGIKGLLLNHQDIEIVGEAENGDVALRQARRLMPDIVLIDLKMPGLDGIDVIRELARDLPKIRSIVLTTYDDEEYISDALEAGASGYLLKNVSHEMLAESIQAVNSGERLLSKDLMGQVLRKYADLTRAQKEFVSGLTPEELQLLRMVSEGKSNKAIAKVMFWSEATVKRRVQDVCDKLGVENRIQAAAEAGKRGLL